MNADRLLAVVAVAQGALLAGLLVLLMLNRWFRVRQRAQVHPRKLASDDAFRAWLDGTSSDAPVVASLDRLPTTVAIDQLVVWCGRAPPELWRELAGKLERRFWTRVVRSNAESARWWKRLECARFLAVAGTGGDQTRIRRLLADPHPAIHVAVVPVIQRVPKASLAVAALDRVPDLGPTVQAYYASILTSARRFVVGRVAELLRTTTGPKLRGLAEFARRLRDPGLLESFEHLAIHSDPEIRGLAARALGTMPHPSATAALVRLAVDRSWPVRAHAVRGLGIVASPTTLATVQEALRDPEWWVRLRAGLALTRFGAAGRNVLLAAEIGAHAAARDVARLVLGLSPAALTEYAA